MDIATKIKQTAVLSDEMSLMFPSTRLRGNGRQKKGHCPPEIHGGSDRKPSLSVSDNKGVWHCFSCGKSGSVIDAYMARYGCDISTAINNLAVKYGITATSAVQVEEKQVEIKETEDTYTLEQQKKAAGMYEASTIVADGRGVGGALEKVAEYLRNRYITPPTLEALTKNIRYTDKIYHSKNEKTGKWNVAEAIVLGIFKVQGESVDIKGIQHIYIKDGYKAEFVDPENETERLPAKKSKGSVGGGCCPIWRGVDHNGEPLAPVGHGITPHIHICEGFENGMVLAEWKPEVPVFISVGLENLAVLKFPRKWQIESATIWTDPPKEGLSDSALQRYWDVIDNSLTNLTSQGIQAVRAQVEGGGDLNDVWMRGKING